MTNRNRYPVPAAILLCLAAVILAALVCIDIYLNSRTFHPSINCAGSNRQQISAFRQETEPKYHNGYMMYPQKKEGTNHTAGAQEKYVMEDGRIILKEASKWYASEIYLTRFFFVCLISGFILGIILKPSERPQEETGADPVTENVS